MLSLISQKAVDRATGPETIAVFELLTKRRTLTVLEVDVRRGRRAGASIDSGSGISERAEGC